MPACATNAAPATADMCALAVGLSVTFAASIEPTSARAWAVTAAPSAPARRHDLAGDRERPRAQDRGEPPAHAGRAHRPNACCSAAATVFTSSIATVMGPTPPGTGVIAPATSATSS